MDAYLLLAPVLLLPVLFLWRLAGCLLDRSGIGSATARTRPALGDCPAGEHVVEFVAVFPIEDDESKEDFYCTFTMTPTTEDDFRYYGSRPLTEDIDIDRTFPLENPGLERFIFFACVEELTEGQFTVNCRVYRFVEGVGSEEAFAGTCTGGPPTTPNTRLQFSPDPDPAVIPLNNTHCFDLP